MRGGENEEGRRGVRGWGGGECSWTWLPSDWNALCAFALVCLKPGPSVRPQRRGINDPQIKLPPHPFLIKNDFSAGNSTFHPLYDHAPSGFSQTACLTVRETSNLMILSRFSLFQLVKRLSMRYVLLDEPGCWNKGKRTFLIYNIHYVIRV